MMRQVRISSSRRRPSRLKKPPGILPAANVFSTYSQVSGKKSRPGRSSPETAVMRTTLSPYEMRIEPCACLASRPVSKVSGLPLTITDSRTKDMCECAPGASAAACGETPGREDQGPLVLGSYARSLEKADHAHESKSKAASSRSGDTV